MRRIAIALLMVAAAAVPAGRATADDGARPIAIAADLSLEDGRTRLSLILSRKVEATAFLLERPDRVVLDLGDVNLQLPPGAGAARLGVVAGFRAGAVGPSRSRIVIDLAQPAAVARLESQDGSPAGAVRLVLDLARTDRDGFRRAAAARSETTGSLPGPSAAPDRRPLVAVDAGHGGANSGALTAAGIPEKDIVLAFARSLRQEIEASGRLRALMIRDDDTFVPLDERVRRAREAGADLFISIHADFMSLASTRGATVYTGAERATDAEAAKLAERENAADLVGGFVAGAPERGVSTILHDLTLRETRGFSHRFAHLLLADLGAVTRFNVQPHREAGFRVLRAHDLPAVLVELGYLSNREDSGLLQSEPWRRRASVAMAGAIERFFAVRSGSGSSAGLGAAVSP